VIKILYNRIYYIPFYIRYPHVCDVNAFIDHCHLLYKYNIYLNRYENNYIEKLSNSCIYVLFNMHIVYQSSMFETMFFKQIVVKEP